MIPPIARTLILTDAGATTYTAALGAFDGTILAPTIANTTGTSLIAGTAVIGLAPLVQQLDQLNAAAAAHLSHLGV